MLLAQRIEVLSTKPWGDAQAALDALRVDVDHWQTQATALVAHASWASVDLKFPPLLDASRGQLLVVWDAFQAALNLAVAAAADASAPLPPVPVWADELRAARGVPAEAPAKALTYDDVKVPFLALVKKNRDLALATLKPFGLDSLKPAKPEQFAAILAALNNALAQP